MKSQLTLSLAATLFAGAAHAVDNNGIDNGTSLGDVTSAAVTGGFDQGGHASDPSGDGRGREERKGLANAVADHELSATIDLIDGD